MKILYIHQYFVTPSMSGITRSYEMARRLVAWGHEVHMITSDQEGRFQGGGWHESVEAGIHVHWACVPHRNDMSFSERIGAFFDFARRAARRCVFIGGDVVFATSTPLTVAIPAVYASKRLKIPMVFEVRDLWPEVPIALGVLKNPLSRGAALWLERVAYRNASRIVVVAPGMKEHVVGKGYPEESVSVVPNGADIDLFDVPGEAGAEVRSQYEWLGDKPLVVYAGTLGMVNGVRHLVDVAAAMAEGACDVRFAVLGSGREEGRLARYAEQRGVLNRNFFMLGQISKERMPAWLSAASVCAVFYEGPEIVWRDSVPNKLFDAFAARRPFISNIRGWSQLLAEREGAGLVLDMSDLGGAGEKLGAFLSDPDRLREAGDAARRLAEGYFNRELQAKELCRVLESAVAGG